MQGVFAKVRWAFFRGRTAPDPRRSGVDAFRRVGRTGNDIRFHGLFGFASTGWYFPNMATLQKTTGMSETVRENLEALEHLKERAKTDKGAIQRVLIGAKIITPRGNLAYPYSGRTRGK